MATADASSRRLRPRIVAAALVLAAPAAALAGDSSLRCRGGIVSIGDTKLDLLAKCGTPALSEAHRAAVGELVSLDGGLAASARSSRFTVERWTYDFGTRSFIQVVTIERGKVRAIERGGYGYADGGAAERPPLAVSRCEPNWIRAGETTYELLARCGEPAVKVRDEEERASSFPVAAGPEGGAVFAATTVVVEAWTYNFGPNRFALTVTIEDGKIVEVERGGYGYRER